MYSDNQLIEQAREGNVLAEETLARRYSKLVRICARQFFLVGGDGEDLIQEGMLGLLNAIRRYDVDGGAGFKTYAERCIRNRLLMAIEAANRMKNEPLNQGVSLEALQEKDGTMVGTDVVFSRRPEEIILEKERVDELRRDYAERLSKYELAVLDLYLDGAPYSEIAKILNKSEKSIDNAIQRIRKKFAKDS